MTIQDIRDNLLKENNKRLIPQELKQAYANGVLDLYTDIKRELIHERRKDPVQSGVS